MQLFHVTVCYPNDPYELLGWFINTVLLKESSGCWRAKGRSQAPFRKLITTEKSTSLHEELSPLVNLPAKSVITRSREFLHLAKFSRLSGINSPFLSFFFAAQYLAWPNFDTLDVWSFNIDRFVSPILDDVKRTFF